MATKAVKLLVLFHSKTSANIPQTDKSKKRLPFDFPRFFEPFFHGIQKSPG
jgi:hypothetical protein